MAKNVYPLGNRIMVELNVAIESEGGIILPKEEVKSGTVKAIGAGVDLSLLDSTELEKFGVEAPQNAIRGMRIGDKVFLPKGHTVGDKFDVDGVLMLVIPPDYITAIIEDE